MIKYVEKNVNPKNRKTTDCVVRALTLATGKDYWKVFDELCQIVKETGYMLNEKRTEDKFLERNGFIKMKQPRKSDNTKYTLARLDAVCSEKTVIVRVAHHLTCVIDNVCYDIWDCRNKTINNYYIRSK